MDDKRQKTNKEKEGYSSDALHCKECWQAEMSKKEWGNEEKVSNGESWHAEEGEVGASEDASWAPAIAKYTFSQV